MSWDGQVGEGVAAAGVGDPGVLPPCERDAAAPSAVSPSTDIYRARKVVLWLLKNYARLHGSLDVPQPEQAMVNGFVRRWAKGGATTPGIRAVITYLREAGCFVESYGGATGQVLMLTPLKRALEQECDLLTRAHNALRSTAPSDRRYRGDNHVPNFLFHALRDHGVPQAERAAAAKYIVEQMVKPYLVSLGFTGPAPEAEPLYADPRPRPVVLTDKEKVIADMQSLVATVEPPAPAAPTVTTLPAEASARLSAAGAAAMARWLATAATLAAVKDE